MDFLSNNITVHYNIFECFDIFTFKNNNGFSPDHRKTRSIGPIELYDLYTAFPCEINWNKEKLPTKREVICHTLYCNKIQKMKWHDAVKEVSTQLESWRVICNAYPIHKKYIEKKLATLIDSHKYLHKRRKLSSKEPWCSKFKEFVIEGDKLLDIICENEECRKLKETETGIPMLQEDFYFYESMKSDRRLCCLPTADHLWHNEEAKSKRRLEKRLQEQHGNLRTVLFDNSADTTVTLLIMTRPMNFPLQVKRFLT